MPPALLPSAVPARWHATGSPLWAAARERPGSGQAGLLPVATPGAAAEALPGRDHPTDDASAVHQRVLGLQRVGEAVEFLEPGIGVMLAVLGVTGKLDGDDVLCHVQALVGAEGSTGDPGADEGASCLVLAPARQFPLGEQALVLRGLLGTDMDDDDVQLAHNAAPRLP